MFLSATASQHATSPLVVDSKQRKVRRCAACQQYTEAFSKTQSRLSVSVRRCTSCVQDNRAVLDDRATHLSTRVPTPIIATTRPTAAIFKRSASTRAEDPTFIIPQAHGFGLITKSVIDGALRMANHQQSWMRQLRKLQPQVWLQHPMLAAPSSSSAPNVVGKLQQMVSAVIRRSSHGLTPFTANVEKHLQLITCKHQLKEFQELASGNDGQVLHAYLNKGEIFPLAGDDGDRTHVVIKRLKIRVPLDNPNHKLLLEAAFQYVINRALPRHTPILLGVTSIEQDDVILVMEYVKGTQLSDLLFESGKAQNDLITKILVEVAVVLGLKQMLNIHHGDLHFNNILIAGEDKRVIFIDFGRASSTSSTPAASDLDSLKTLMTNLSDCGLLAQPTQHLQALLNELQAVQSSNVQLGCVFWFRIARQFGAGSLVSSIPTSMLQQMAIPNNLDQALTHGAMASFTKAFNTAVGDLEAGAASVSFELAGTLLASLCQIGESLHGVYNKGFMEPWRNCGLQNLSMVLLAFPSPLELMQQGLLRSQCVRGLERVLVTMLEASRQSGIPTPAMSLNLSKMSSEDEALHLFETFIFCRQIDRQQLSRTHAKWKVFLSKFHAAFAEWMSDALPLHQYVAAEQLKLPEFRMRF